MKKIFAAFFTLTLLVGCSATSNKISTEEATAKANDFVNEYLLGPGQIADVKYVGDEAGMYAFKIDLGDREVDGYLTYDGGNFIPQVMNISDMKAEIEAERVAAAEAEANRLKAMPKTEKPVVELFVMSHCPYGTQAEKGFLPVADLLGDEADMQIKFVNYTMHGETEVREQLFQTCVMQEEGQEKYLDYLECFLDSGDSASCRDGLDTEKLAACETTLDQEYGVLAALENPTGNYPEFAIYAAENKKYGVDGSPTLVVNGYLVEGASRDPAGILKTVCAGFENAPEICETAELSSVSPSPGFGSGTTDAPANGSC